MTPWDGIWTEELLRDLCGGVTRDTGSLKVQPYVVTGKDRLIAPRGKPVTVRRVGKRDYCIGIGPEVEAESVVERLNQMLAVPLYETGKEWKVKRPSPEELAVKCPECYGTSSVECGSCDGTGDCECHCGHQHECHECDGNRKVPCPECQPARVA